MKKTTLLLGMVFLSVAALAADTQKIIDVQSVQKVIQQKNAGWVAKENWVSKLSQSEIKRMLGLQELPQGSLDYDFEGRNLKQAGAIDWRNNNGVNWLGPVMNQGNCGSCVAFASVATLEARTSIAAGNNWLKPTFSPQMLFACGGGSCESGWMPGSAASFLKKTGIVDEACMNYTSGSTGDDASCSAKCSDSAARTTKITGSSSLGGFMGMSADTVKTALKTGPLVTTLTVYADFVTYAGGVYKHVTGSQLGGHAVSLVGYDDAKQAWLIRNSWGEEWGEKGFMWVSYSDTSGVASSTWALNVSPSNGMLSVSSPSDKEYVSGNYSLGVQTQNLKGEQVTFHVSSQGKEVLTLGCTASASADVCNQSLDTTKMAEGRYEIYAQSPSLKSQVREFYVINSEPAATIKMSAATGTDLTKPQNGRPEFNIEINSTPVPLQHIEFRAINKDGKVVAVKSNDYVLPEMKMGWRTMTVPNGQYTILFHGRSTYLGKTYEMDSNSFTVTVTGSSSKH